MVPYTGKCSSRCHFQRSDHSKVKVTHRASPSKGTDIIIVIQSSNLVELGSVCPRGVACLQSTHLIKGERTESQDLRIDVRLEMCHIIDLQADGVILNLYGCCGSGGNWR